MTRAALVCGLSLIGLPLLGALVVLGCNKAFALWRNRA